MKKMILSLVAGLLFTTTASAAIKSEMVEYKEGNTVLEGYVVYDDAKKGKLPGVVVIHNWMGLSDETKSKANQLAELGYVAFAADIYGKGVKPKDKKEAGALAGKFKGDRKLLRVRAMAAYDTLKKHSRVDGNNLSASGYCFGGTTAIEMALTGAPLRGVVSFHGGLQFPNMEDTKNIKSKVLILHGAIDPNVPPAEVSAFTTAMDNAKTDYQLIAYSGAVHSFTEKAAGNDNSKGAAYNEAADKRSWIAMKSFFSEVTR